MPGSARFKPKPAPQPMIVYLPAQPQTTEMNGQGSGFISDRLARVRKQLAAVDTEIEAGVPDSKRLRVLTELQHRLADQERVLSGRPLPGSRKPRPERSGAVVDVEPLPVQPSQAPAPPGDKIGLQNGQLPT